MKILVVNCGSSSLKYQLIDMDTEESLAKGTCEAIGDEGNSIFQCSNPAGGKYRIDNFTITDHVDAFNYVVKALTDDEYGCKVIDSVSEIDAIGHRVVQGGWIFNESVKVDRKVIDDIAYLSFLAPLHNHAAVQGIESCIKKFGDEIPMVTVFDNAYHSTMPDCAYTFPVPKEYIEKYHIRRYGFHGTSHKYINSEVKKILGKDEYKLISCHIGSGASIAAIKDGIVMDTSMGLTPLDGFVMGTRCGGVDPSVITFIMEQEDIAPADMNNIMNKKSGMRGLCGEDDERQISVLIENGSEDAALARRVQHYQIRKYIGSYVAALDGVDIIVFTAGIGEHSAVLRKGICDNLNYLGVKLDNAANESVNSVGGIVKISAEDSRVLVYVIPTNEELMIARETKAIVEG